MTVVPLGFKILGERSREERRGEEEMRGRDKKINEEKRREERRSSEDGEGRRGRGEGDDRWRGGERGRRERRRGM